MKRETTAMLLPGDPRDGSIESAAYYPWFDWLRAICASVVVLAHDGALNWSNAGNFAVLVFFALSGWLIGGILLDTAAGEMPRFFFNRALRIWVPYYIAVVLLLSLAVWRDPITAKWLEIVSYKLTFVYNLFGTRQLDQFVNAMPEKGTLSHVWSVNAEEQFYLVAPLLIVFGARRVGHRPITWIGIALLSIFVAPTYTPIILGVLAATVVRRYGPVHRTLTCRTILLVILAAGIVGLVFAPDHYQIVAPFPAIAIVLLLAMPGLQQPGGALFGGMSYQLYLNHWITLYAFNWLRWSGPLRHALVVALAIAIASAMYWWIDRPVLAARAKLYTPLRGRVLTGSAYALVALGGAIGFVLWR